MCNNVSKHTLVVSGSAQHTGIFSHTDTNTGRKKKADLSDYKRNVLLFSSFLCCYFVNEWLDGEKLDSVCSFHETILVLLEFGSKEDEARLYLGPLDALDSSFIKYDT